METTHTPGDWQQGKIFGTVISNIVPPGYITGTGRDNVEYYGGFLIGESITPYDMPIIAAAPNMLAALHETLGLLKELDVTGGTAFDKINAAIAKATNNTK